MKSNTPNWPLLIFVAVCALGAGITGTILWTQSRQQSTLVPIAAAPIAPITAPTNQSSTSQTSTNETSTSETSTSETSTHEPPPNLTVGMSPAQSALMLGNWYYDHKAWPRAIEWYQKAIHSGIENADIRTDLGSAFRFNGDANKALQQYAIAQKQNPAHENSLFNQGGVYAFDLKQPQKGIEVWRKYLQKFPNGQNVAQAHELIEKAQAQIK